MQESWENKVLWAWIQSVAPNAASAFSPGSCFLPWKHLQGVEDQECLHTGMNLPSFHTHLKTGCWQHPFQSPANGDVPGLPKQGPCIHPWDLTQSRRECVSEEGCNEGEKEPSKVQVRSNQREPVQCAKFIYFRKLANGSFDLKGDFLFFLFIYFC